MTKNIRLPSSVRKFLRTEKARLRNLHSDPKEANVAISRLVASVRAPYNEKHKEKVLN